jgi:hypothetical protein
MLSRIPSVSKDTYFQHKLLTKIHGKPTYESLQNGLTELKANASSVPSTLGGGHYGHLCLLLSEARYTALDNTAPFVNPGNPGPFAPPAAGTGPQIEAAKEVWKQLQQTFELCQATQKALIAQIVEMIDLIYLRALLNQATGQYSSSICALLLHLFTTYGRITPQQVKTKEIELLNMHYDISQPVLDNVFNSIDDLSDLAESASSPMTSQQIVDLAYVIFAKHPILQPDLRLWNRKPAAERTWENMMAHLRDAQSDLSSLPMAGDMYHQPPPHQANITTMAEPIAQHLLDDPCLMPSPHPAPPTLPTPPLLETPDVPLTSMDNSPQCRETDVQTREASMMNQMQEMMMLMRTGTNHNNGGNNNQNNGGNNGYNHNNGGNNGHNQNNRGNNGYNQARNNNNGNTRYTHPCADRSAGGRSGGRTNNRGAPSMRVLLDA